MPQQMDASHRARTFGLRDFRPTSIRSGRCRDSAIVRAVVMQNTPQRGPSLTKSKASPGEARESGASGGGMGCGRRYGRKAILCSVWPASGYYLIWYWIYLVLDYLRIL